MKRFTYAMVMAVALVVMVSSFAVAGDDCKSKTEAKSASTKASCSEAEKAACATSATAKTASADKAACAATCASTKTAAEKAACEATCTDADKAAYKAASADMHKCCAAAMAEGKGCCGKDADALQASYTEKVAYYQACAAVEADMHKCCASAMAEGKGCCGHSAEEMKADYDKKVEAELKKVASQDQESNDS